MKDFLVLYNCRFVKNIFQPNNFFKFNLVLVILMDKVNLRGIKNFGSRYSIDSFCEEVVGDFESGVRRGLKYSGLYIFSDNSLSQLGLNRLRDGVCSRLSPGVVRDYPVISSTIAPNGVVKYDAKFPGLEGWYCVNVSWFVKNKGLEI